MSELTARRWDKDGGSPNSHKAIEALDVARHRIETGEWLADHVIVIVGSIDGDGGANTSFTQAGKLDAYGQLGLLDVARDLMNQKA